MTPLISSLQQLTVRLLCSTCKPFFIAKPSKTHSHLLGSSDFGAAIMWETWNGALWGIFFSQTWVCLHLSWKWTPGKEKSVRSFLWSSLEWSYTPVSSTNPLVSTSLDHLCLLWAKVCCSRNINIPKDQRCIIAQHCDDARAHTQCVWCGL